MKADLSVKKEKIKGKDGWTVYGKVEGRDTYRHGRFTAKAKAYQRKDEILRKCFSKFSTVTEEEQEKAVHAVRRLKTQSENEEAKGKDIEFAVDWFIRRFRDDSGVKTVDEYVKDFLAERDRLVEIRKNGGTGGLSPVTVRNDRYFLKLLAEEYGEKKPTDLTTDNLKAFCDSFAPELHSFKVVYGFFSWLSNAHSKMQRLREPAFRAKSENPFYYYKRPERKLGKILIANNDEVIEILRLAKENTMLPFFVFGFFLGIRPHIEGELLKFLKLENCWKYIDLRKGTLSVPKVMEKTTERSRVIALKPNVKRWLKYFRENDISFKPINVVDRRRETLRAVIKGDRAKHPDLMRHTCISNRCKVDKFMHEICRECATSEQMIRDHYQTFVSESSAKAFFRIGPEILEGV